MKICNIGHARSRSTYLTQHLSNHYNLYNYSEIYSSCKSYKPNKDKLDNYRNTVKNFTNQLVTKNKFIIKVWPIFFSSDCLLNCNNLILNLNECFRFDLYDQIIVTYRDPITALCSLNVSKRFGFNFNNIAKLNESLHLRYSDMTYIDLYDRNNLSFLQEIFLIPLVIKYLRRKNINFIELEYTSIPEYLNRFELTSQKTPISRNKIPSVIDTKTDYKKCISNYNEVQDFVHKYREENKVLLENIQFI